MSNDFTNDPAAYLQELQRIEREQELAKLRTLCLEFAGVLDYFPKLREELDAFHHADGIAFDGLADRLRPTLKQAADFQFEIEHLPADIRHASEIADFVQSAQRSMTLQTVELLVAKLPPLCSSVREQFEREKRAAAQRLKRNVKVGGVVGCVVLLAGLIMYATSGTKPPVAPTPTVALPAPPAAVAATAAPEKVLIASRYQLNGDGTVTDTNTGLMWKQCSEGQSGKDCSLGDATRYRWDDAMSRFGKEVRFAGYNDWRMPTKDELRTLVYCSNGTLQQEAWEHWCDGKDDKAGEYQRPTINLTAFPYTPESANFWSSSPVASSSGSAWHVGFDGGDSYWYDKNSAFQVRLVRSGQ